jgi:hypothetical protein
MEKILRAVLLALGILLLLLGAYVAYSSTKGFGVPLFFIGAALISKSLSGVWSPASKVKLMCPRCEEVFCRHTSKKLCPKCGAKLDPWVVEGWGIDN